MQSEKSYINLIWKKNTSPVDLLDNFLKNMLITSGISGSKPEKLGNLQNL